jgi:hypothetical protein
VDARNTTLEWTCTEKGARKHGEWTGNTASIEGAVHDVAPNPDPLPVVPAPSPRKLEQLCFLVSQTRALLLVMLLRCRVLLLVAPIRNVWSRGG